MKLAIIDGDVLAYQACRSRWEKKAIIEGGTTTFFLDETGKKKPLEFTKEEDRRYLEESWGHFQKDLKLLVDGLFCEHYLMAVKGENNFRNLMYPEYKMNRHADPNKQNAFVPVLRKLAVAEDLAIEATNCEADDLIRIWAEEARASGDDFIICSIDKDLRCIPGMHYFMHKGKERLVEVTEEEARMNYYIQLLRGDPTDNIPGVPGIGEVKAAKALAGCVSEEDFQEVVVSHYIAAYQELWKEYLISNGKMIHIMKSPVDWFSLESWKIVKELQ